MRPLHAAALALALVACDSQVRSDPEPTPAPAPPPSDPVVKAHMGGHFGQGASVRDAIVMGDVGAAQAGFQALADHPVAPGLPEGSKPFVQAYQQAARLGADDAAPTPGAQAKQLATVVQACGGCHATNNVKHEWKVPDAPPRDPGVRAHMARHGWAIERMYEGLVGPTESSWSQAAAILNDHALDEAHLPSDKPLPADAAAAAERLHDLGKEALEAGTPEARGALFAEALTTCATCHGAVGVGKAAPAK